MNSYRLMCNVPTKFSAVDIALLANSLAQAESMLQSLERTAGSIYLYVNADKTEKMCFNQRGDISTEMSSETSGQVHLPRK